MQPVARDAVEGLDAAYTEASLDFTTGIQTTGTTIDARWNVTPDHEHILLLLYGRTPNASNWPSATHRRPPTNARPSCTSPPTRTPAASACGSTPTRKTPPALQSHSKGRTPCSPTWGSASRATSTAAPCTGSAGHHAPPADGPPLRPNDAAAPARAPPRPARGAAPPAQLSTPGPAMDRLGVGAQLRQAPFPLPGPLRRRRTAPPSHAAQQARPGGRLRMPRRTAAHGAHHRRDGSRAFAL